MRQAIFLDRDGTIIEDQGLVPDPSLVKLMPQAAEAIKLLRDAGFLLIVVTNQSGISKGTTSRETFHGVNESIRLRLKEAGTRIDAMYFCVHTSEDKCACRKPAPGMLLEAAHDRVIDMSQSYMIGDKESDIDAGMNAGCRVALRMRPDKTLLGLAQIIVSMDEESQTRSEIIDERTD